VIFASFSEYLPLDDLVRILIACLVVAVVAPSSVAVAISGLDRRHRAAERDAGDAAGTALVVAGAAVLVALVLGGVYVLYDH
jgi:ABC-type Fe3+ transport system permease subunit